MNTPKRKKGSGIWIGAGRHRGRKLVVPPGVAVRPTAARIREALFNILAHNNWTVADGPLPSGAHVLDAFAGSGALGLEALSRGAARVFLLETDRAARTAATANVKKLYAEGKAFVLPRDATNPGPPPEKHPFTLVLADPPYHSGLGTKALIALSREGWLSDSAVAALELAADESFAPPGGFSLTDNRKYGRTRIAILEQTK